MAIALVATDPICVSASIVRAAIGARHYTREKRGCKAGRTCWHVLTPALDLVFSGLLDIIHATIKVSVVLCRGMCQAGREAYAATFYLACERQKLDTSINSIRPAARPVRLSKILCALESATEQRCIGQHWSTSSAIDTHACFLVGCLHIPRPARGARRLLHHFGQQHAAPLVWGTRGDVLRSLHILGRLHQHTGAQCRRQKPNQLAGSYVLRVPSANVTQARECP